MFNKDKTAQIEFSLEKALAELNEKINKLEIKSKHNYLPDLKTAENSSPYLEDGAKLLKDLENPTSFEDLAKKIQMFDPEQSMINIVKILKIVFDGKEFSSIEYQNFLTRYSSSKKLIHAWKNCKKFFKDSNPFVWFYPYLRRDTATKMIKSGEKIFLIRHSGTFNNFFVASYLDSRNMMIMHYLIGITDDNNFYLSDHSETFPNPEDLLLKYYGFIFAKGRKDCEISAYCAQSRIDFR